MESMEQKNALLCGALMEKIALCKRDYEENRDDTSLSTLLASKLGSLEELHKRLQGGEDPGELMTELKGKLPGLEQDMEREAECPSFDWYDEHHYYKVFSGQRKAILEVIELLDREAEAACLHGEEEL